MLLTSSFGMSFLNVRRLAARVFALGACAFALAACGQNTGGGQDTSADLIGGPFALTDHTGATFTDEDLRGDPFLVFFGFTYCPDVCPLTLNKLAVALDMLPPEDAERFQSILITVDPERDTPEQLALYVNNFGFPEDLRGLTGSLEDIQAVADAYRVHFQKIESEDTASDYLMEHSSVLYLMDAEGRFDTVFTHASAPMEIADGLRRHLEDHG